MDVITCTLPSCYGSKYLRQLLVLICNFLDELMFLPVQFAVSLTIITLLVLEFQKLIKICPD